MKLYSFWFYRQRLPTYSQWRLTDGWKNKLRKLFPKSPKFRKTINISWDKADSTIIEGLNSCTDICAANMT